MKNICIKISCLLFAVLLSGAGQSAPIPGTSSSSLVKPELGIYRSPMGFEVSSGGTTWLPTKVPKKSRFIEALYRSPQKALGTQATLTVRVDNLKKAVQLNRYMVLWKKEYPRFGFDILGSRAFKLNGQHGYVVDLINRDKKRQIRQVIFMKDAAAVILTCRDHVSNFKKSLASCNEIIRSFAWAKDSPPSKKL